MSTIPKLAMLAGAVWAIGSLGVVRADEVVWSQPPNHLGGHLSDTDASAAGFPWQLSADHFLRVLPATAWRVSWYGFYGSQTVIVDPPPPEEETFRVRFYANRPGVPGDVLYEEFFENPERAWTGITCCGGPARREYRYEVQLAEGFDIELFEVYWLEIVKVGTPDSYWRWEDATGGVYAIKNPTTPGADWYLVEGQGQLAYELRTPEPSVAGLLIAGGYSVARTRRRRGRR